jgi:LacI family transcriptional regulator
VGKGFRSFAYIGHSDASFSMQRESSFQEGLNMAGMPPARVLHTERYFGAKRVSGEAADKAFMISLPTPCAVFCATDERGAEILGLARDCELAVPEQLSILGVDNDPMLCQMANPALSSINTNARQIGVAFAQRLDQLMRGNDPGPAPRVVPIGVVERLSTAWAAVSDPHLVKAITFIKENVGRQVSVDEVARAAGVSRRALEYRFGEHFQTSVGAFLRKRTVNAIKSLLLETDYSLEQIAEIVGIGHLQHLYTMFQRLEKCTPARFRREHRGANL